MNEQPSLEYVGFWARVVAALIDTAALLIVTLPLTYVFYGQMRPSGESMVQGPMDIIINWLLPAAVVIWLWTRLQATPGKMALSARIVDAQTGQPPSLTQCVV